MTDFEEGARVRYCDTGPVLTLRGQFGTVAGIARHGWIVVDFDGGQHVKCAGAHLTEVFFLNHYRCPMDGSEWSDEWPSACDDECPSCGAEIEPYSSKEIIE